MSEGGSDSFREQDVVRMLTEAGRGFEQSAEAAALGIDPGPYERLLGLALYLIRRVAEHDETPCEAVLDVAERVLRHGDLRARELVEFGLLGELANTNLWPDGFDPRWLPAHVGPLASETRAIRRLQPPRAPRPDGRGVVVAELYLRRRPGR